MEWLKKLIEGAKKNEDGSIDIEDIMRQINAEFPKNAVPKSEFNDINEQLKKANGTITELKKNNADNETLQKTIKEHEDTIENLKADSEKTKREYTLKDKLRDMSVTDPDYLIYKHGGVDKFNFDKEGNPVGLEEAVNPYRESIPHIFKTGKTDTDYNPAGGSNYQGKNPFAKGSADFNMTEAKKLFDTNPAQAREMAAAAGFKI